MAYSDLHDHLKKLEAAGYLRRIQRNINKDTDYPHPLDDWMTVQKVEALKISEAEKLESLEEKACYLLKL